MAVTIHRVNTILINVDSSGEVILKNAPATKLKNLTNFTTEHRIFPYLSGPCSTVNSADYPTVNGYLAAEATSGFSLVYMDQYSIITQKIT